MPLSYLGTLTERIEKTTPLTYEEQSALIVDLRANVRDSETKDDALKLLRVLRKRRDLLASIAGEIDDVLERQSTSPTARAGTTGGAWAWSGAPRFATS